MKKQIHQFACFIAVFFVILSCSSCQSKAEQTEEIATERLNTEISENAMNEISNFAETTTAPTQNSPDTSNKPNSNDTQSTSKPSGGGNTTKPNTPSQTTPSEPQEPVTSQPSKPEPKPTEPETPAPPATFAMTPDEIIAYGRSICNKKPNLILRSDATKYNSAWNTPSGIYPEDTIDTIKRRIEGAINSTFRNIKQSCPYNIYVENLGESYKIYILYGER